MTAYVDAMRRYADFNGRSTRAQYWLNSLTVFIIAVVALVVDGAIGSGPADGPGIVTVVVILAHLVPGLAVAVRRLHDIDRSGWWMLIAFVPLIGAVTLLVFACTGSTGPNRFGQFSAQRDDQDHRRMEPRASDGMAIDQIEKLAALRNSGAIDDEEFKQMKAKAMGRTAV